MPFFISTLYCLLELAESHLEHPLGLPNVGLRDLIDHSSLPLFQVFTKIRVRLA